MSEFVKIETKIIEILEIMYKAKMSSITHHQDLGGFHHKPAKSYKITIKQISKREK